jgi:hypothetical protein
MLLRVQAMVWTIGLGGLALAGPPWRIRRVLGRIWRCRARFHRFDPGCCSSRLRSGCARALSVPIMWTGCASMKPRWTIR